MPLLNMNPAKRRAREIRRRYHFTCPSDIERVLKAENVKVVQTKEDWPLNALVAVPAQILEKQSLKGVDSVSGATCTAEAVLIGAGKALASARRK